jgi:uncharacterized membrane protein HdeD (DUF308 family)
MARYDGLQPIKHERDWKVVGAGALLSVVAIVFLVWPQGSLVTLTAIAGIVLIVSGIVDLVTTGQMRGSVVVAPWLTTYGVLDLIVGLLLIVFPRALSVVLPWLIGIAFIVFGIFELSSAQAMRKVHGSFGSLSVASGVVGILCGIMLFVAPSTIVVLMGIYLLVRGVSMIVRGYNEDRFFA